MSQINLNLEHRKAGQGEANPGKIYREKVVFEMSKSP